MPVDIDGTNGELLQNQYHRLRRHVRQFAEQWDLWRTQVNLGNVPYGATFTSIVLRTRDFRAILLAANQVDQAETTAGRPGLFDVAADIETRGKAAAEIRADYLAMFQTLQPFINWCEDAGNISRTGTMVAPTQLAEGLLCERVENLSASEATNLLAQMQIVRDTIGNY